MGSKSPQVEDEERLLREGLRLLHLLGELIDGLLRRLLVRPILLGRLLVVGEALSGERREEDGEGHQEPGRGGIDHEGASYTSPKTRSSSGTLVGNREARPLLLYTPQPSEYAALSSGNI